jgi:predicted metalloprotease with PDZ domain
MSRPWSCLTAVLILVLSGALGSAQSPLEELEAKIRQGSTLPEGGKGEQPSMPATAEETLPAPSSSAAGRKVELEGFGPSQASPEQLRQPARSSTKPLDMPQAEEPPYLGLTLERTPDAASGLKVLAVREQSPAWKSGFRIGDRLLAIAGEAVDDIETFTEKLSKQAAYRPVAFLVERRGRQIELLAVMLPRSLAARWESSAAERLVEELRRRSSPTLEPRTPQPLDPGLSLGLAVASLSEPFRRQFGIPVYRGASVLEVRQGSAAFLAGLAPGDCIVGIDGQAISSDSDLLQWKSTSIPGSSANVIFYRGGQKLRTSLELPPQESHREDSALALEPTPITPEMLTPEFVIALQRELANAREELDRLREQLQPLPGVPR